ncbi:hypothetical protein R1sor_003885 [Riccia sorocarpa]|uniref:Uncharacterized protein n=1 Tax=Riccia sorocarpa TaxID=122646 RepID=A0ABD3H2Y8_9MARC
MVLPQEIPVNYDLFELNLLSGVVIVMDEQQGRSPSASPSASPSGSPSASPAPTVVGDSSDPFGTCRRDDDLSEDKENPKFNIERTVSDHSSSANGSRDTVPADILKINLEENDKNDLTNLLTPKEIVTYHRRRALASAACGGNSQAAVAPSPEPTEFNVQLLVKPLGGSPTDPGLPQFYLCCPPLIRIKHLAEHLGSKIPAFKGRNIEFLVPRSIHRQEDSNLRPFGTSDKQVLHDECTLDYAWSKLWDDLGDLVLEYREALDE